MGVSLEEIGVSSLEEARRKLKYKQCEIGLATNDKRVGCSTGTKCPLQGTISLTYYCSKICFKKCKLNRGKR